MNTNVDTSPESLDDAAVKVADGVAPQPAEFNVQTEAPGTLLPLRSGDSLNSQEIRQTLEKGLRFLVLFPDFLSETFGEYQKPLTTVGLVLAAGLGIAVADGVLTRLNTIPLFAPFFELIGLGFTGWFIARYLLYADTRNELIEEYRQVKTRITGDRPSES